MLLCRSLPKGITRPSSVGSDSPALILYTTIHLPISFIGPPSVATTGVGATRVAALLRLPTPSPPAYPQLCHHVLQCVFFCIFTCINMSRRLCFLRHISVRLFVLSLYVCLTFSLSLSLWLYLTTGNNQRT